MFKVLVQTLQYLKQNFAYENMKKPPSEVAHNLPKFCFSTANQTKTSPNYNFCSLKIAHCETCIMTLGLGGAMSDISKDPTYRALGTT